MPWQSVDGWLDELASGTPTPGGGGAAALTAATGAALVSMVCQLTIGKPRYAEHEEKLRAVLTEATALRGQALELAEADARAFGTVIAAYRLAQATGEQKQARGEAIQAALAAAADVPLRVAALAAAVIRLAADIVDRSNVNVLSDVAVAAVTARAALEAAAINVEVNRAGLTGTGTRARLAGQLAAHTGAAAAADAVAAQVRVRLAG